MGEKRAFSGLLSQVVVVCLLAFLIVITLIAMFSTVQVIEEINWIGMTVEPLEAETAAALGFPPNAGGVIVGGVDGIAKRAGFRQGDVLLSLNGQPVRDMFDLSKLARETDLTRGSAQFDILRRGARMPIFVPPRGGPAGQSAPAGIARAALIREPKWLGIEAEPLTARERSVLGIPAGVQGVLIDDVTKGGFAHQAGLAAQDVLIAVNGQRIVTATDLWRTLTGLEGGDRIEFGIYRRGRLMSVVSPAEWGTGAREFPGGRGR